MREYGERACVNVHACMVSAHACMRFDADSMWQCCGQPVLWLSWASWLRPGTDSLFHADFLHRPASHQTRKLCRLAFLAQAMKQH